MNLENRLRIAVGKRNSDVFLRSEFAQFGSEAQVGRALRKLVSDGVMVKLGLGVYAKAKRSVISGNAIPVQSVEILAEQALEKLGVQIYPSKLVADYNAGRTTQLPVVTAINTGDRRIRRKLRFGKKIIEYENDRESAKTRHERPAFRPKNYR